VAPIPEIKEAKTAPVTRSQATLGPSTTTNVVALSDLYAKASGYLVKIAHEESKDSIVELAMGMVKNRFEVEDPMTIPEGMFDELRTYLRGELIDTLRNEGLVGK
jgi:hypothetical protein